MEQLDSYQKEKLTINLVWANVFGILIIIPIVLLYGLPYYLIWGSEITRQSFKDTLLDASPVNIGIGTLLFFLILTAGMILHELIHGLTWARYTEKGLKSMKFGVLWTMLTPYCHCKEPLKVRQYILGAITPTIFLGLIPAVISILIGSLGLLVFGIFFTMAAGGDFLIINLLRKEKMDNLVQDHPSEAGCFVYRKIEIE
jgi:hypothetical protein